MKIIKTFPFALFISIVILTACFNKKKNEPDSILTPKIEDKEAPVIDLGIPIALNINDPLIKDIWPEYASRFTTGDSFELNASFRDDRKLDRFWFEIGPVLQLSQDNSAWEIYDLKFLTGTIRGVNNKYKIPQSVDGGFYKLTLNCIDSAGNLATPMQTYFVMLNAFDGIVPHIEMTTLDTNNYNNNFLSIGETLNIDGAVSDNISVKYMDVRIKNKNSKVEIASILSQDQAYLPSIPITSSWTVPAGTPLGWYQAVVRAVDRYNNIDSLVVDFRVQP